MYNCIKSGRVPKEKSTFEELNEEERKIYMKELKQNILTIEH